MATVAVVDDEKAMELLLCRELRARGVDTEFHRGADAFLRRLAERGTDAPFDLVVLDLRMPVLDGHEVLDRLRSTAGHEHLPVIVLSGSSLPADRDEAWRRGVVAYVAKPDDLAGFRDLADLVSRYVALNHPAGERSGLL